MTIKPPGATTVPWPGSTTPCARWSGPLPDGTPNPPRRSPASQSVRAAGTVPKATRGWDNAKKVNGRKRHIAVDTTGLVLAVVITAANTQDRDAARPLLWNLHHACRRIRLVWADAGYTSFKPARPEDEKAQCPSGGRCPGALASGLCQ